MTERNTDAMPGFRPDPAQDLPGEKPGSWMVYRPGDRPREYWYFIEWRHGKPIIGQCDGMVFTYEGMARHVAEQLGDRWLVVDVNPEACLQAERLLAAIFRDDDAEEPETDEEE